MSPTVNIEKLRFQYDARADFELRIEQLGLQAGKSYLLFGRSGLGKTTLLNLMAGVLRPNSGHIEICGTDLASLSRRATDRFRGDNIGFIFQTLNLIPWLSARDNVELALTFSPERRARLTASLADSLAELFDRLDFGLRPCRCESATAQHWSAAACAGGARLNWRAAPIAGR